MVTRHVTDAMSLLNVIQVGATFMVARHVTDVMSTSEMELQVGATFRVARHATDAMPLSGWDPSWCYVQGGKGM